MADQSEHSWRRTLRRRLAVATCVFAVWSAAIEARLIYLQVLQHDELLAAAEDQQLVAGVAKVRDQIQAVATDLGVTVNPRYEPFQVSVLRIDTETVKRDLLSTDFGDYEPLPVKDVS